MSKQEQTVAEGGQAVQALRDVNYHQGLSVDQMLQIMEGIERQIQRGIGQAEQIVNSRLDEFRDSVLEEFSKNSAQSNVEAFADPDFQHALHEAQKGFVRSGERGLKEELVKLLSQRSNQTERTRTALILNEAIQTISSLTSQEISALVITFIFQDLQFNSPGGMGLLTQNYKGWITEFANDYPDNDFSFEYLTSMRCTIINQISHHNIWNILTERYENIFTRGFVSADIPPCLFVGRDQVVERVPAAVDGRLRFKPHNRSKLEGVLSEIQVSDSCRVDLLSLFDRTKLSKDDLIDAFLKTIPELEEVIRRWDSTAGKMSQLTGLGKTIAHSALASRTDFRAPLSIWVS